MATKKRKRRKRLSAKLKEEQQEQATIQAGAIEDFIENIQAAELNVSTSYRVNKNPNGSVRSQVRIFDISKRMTIEYLTLEIENMIDVPPRTFLWVDFLGEFEEAHYPKKGKRKGGKRIMPKLTPKEEKEQRYLKQGSLDKINIYPQRWDIGEPYMWKVVREKVLKGLRRARKRRPEIVLVNLYWSITGTKPNTRYSR